MSVRAVFWLVFAFLMLVDVILMLLSVPVGIIVLCLIVLAIALMILLRPDWWQRVKPSRGKKKQGTDVKPTKQIMVLERCDNRTIAPIVIDHSPFELGRSAECDYMLENMPSVGRHHCRIIYKETTNNYYIEDLNSKNGTFVNSFRLVPNTPQLLKPDNMVALDKYQFIFKQKA